MFSCFPVIISGDKINMIKFREATQEENDEIAVKNGIFPQTSGWASFRSFMRPVRFIGVDDEQIVMSCQVLLLPVYLTPWSIGYITRGPVFNGDISVDLIKQIIRDFSQYLRDWAVRRKLIYIISDPYTDWKIDFGESNGVRECFEESGWKYNTKSVLQPRTNYRLFINRETDCSGLFSGFTQRLKNDIRFSRDRGVTLEKCGPDQFEKGISVFYKLLVETTEKKGFGHRNEQYYLDFAENLKDYVTIYLYKYDYEKDRAYTDKILRDVEDHLKVLQDEYDSPETTVQKKQRLEPKIREAHKQIDATLKRITISEKYKDDPYLSASFYIKMGNKAYNFFGANALALRELKLTAHYADMLEDSFDGNVETFNMGGTLKLDTENIKDDRMYDLYMYKKEYGGEFVEMPGEFYMIVRPKLYGLFHDKLNYFRRIVFRK